MLVRRTAQLLDLNPRVEMELEDIQQVLRIKVFKALLAWTPSRSRTSRDRYVFMCLRDQAKDVLKRVRRGELHIEDLVTTEADSGAIDTRDRFDERYLSQTHEQIYSHVEEEELLLPSTLTRLEREIVTLLFRDYKQAEAARMLGLEKREIEKSMRSIRSKMADWDPGTTSPAPSSQEPDRRTAIAA